MAKLRIKVFSTEVEYDGDEAFLQAEWSTFMETAAKSHNEQTKADLNEGLEMLQRDAAGLESTYQSILQLQAELAQAWNHYREKMDRSLVDLIDRIGGRQTLNRKALVSAIKQLQETQMSFNLQYLQLQSQMQNENRSYTAISNIMKTKHDTVKNSISNIR